MLVSLLMVALVAQGPVQSAPVAAHTQATKAEVETATTAFSAAFLAADVEKFAVYFADKVTFEGDLRFLGAPQKAGVMEPTRDELTKAYARMFAAMGRDNFAAVVKSAVRELKPIAKDGELFSVTKTGDWVYSLSLPGRTGDDDVLMFVFRRVDGGYRIIAHWADY
jgi:hypothetical protein